MNSIRLSDYITFDGADWQVTAQNGATLTLTDLSTGDVCQVSVVELRTDESYLPDSPDRLPDLDATAVLDTLDAETRDSPPARL